ncbi:glycosyltransferase [Candidatus Woesearchaeota archaeon]|nr:glycosyltransferase [Candidatus Woesearchaeota archaeon]MCF7900982.1 glycosyltransferase [Candidatus Woesearchaeota archaeon]MCF8013302.1 glycosyltransferase [Candidatus Woesearchaeota archaeon]
MDKKKLTIVNVLYARPHLGGSGKVGLEIGKEMARRGHDVHIISYSDTYLSGDEKNLLKLHPVHEVGYDSFKVPPSGLVFPSEIRNLAEEIKIDILHAHYAIQHGEAVIDGRECIRMDMHELNYEKVPKAVTTLHGTDISVNGYKRAIGHGIRLRLSQMDFLTFVSQDLQNQAKNLFKLDNYGVVIQNFIDETKFNIADAEKVRMGVRNELNIPLDAVVFYHTSNFRPVKNTSAIVDAFHLAKLNENNFPKNAFLLFFGNGPEKSHVESKVKQYGLENRVIFTDTIQYEDMPRYIHAGDVHVLPSLKEACPLVNLEAMAVKKPIIASNVGGIPEQIIDGETGFLIEPQDTVALSKYVGLLSLDEDLRRSMGEKGYKLLNKKFSRKEIGDAYENMYYDLLNTTK